MTSLQAILIGIVQGIAEFLPISSSAHLKLIKVLLGIQSEQSEIVFDLVCHLGTLTALLYFLRQELAALYKENKKQLVLLIIASFPLIPFYFLLTSLRDLACQEKFLGFFLILTGVILFVGQHLRFKKEQSASYKDALWIGSMQALALIPGISRSASTISCARVLGWEIKKAVRFSFLLSIPTVIGGNALELFKIAYSSEAPLTYSFSSFALGFFASLAVGLFSIRFAIRILDKGNFRPFVYYCIGLGSIVTIYFHFFFIE